MTQEQLLIVAILLATMLMFVTGRWRHDMVAGAALLACVLSGLIPADEAFSGFAHPAVVTVACVLVLSRALQYTGAVDLLTRHALPADAGPTLSLMALTGLGALLSGFMNNVGAMALLMPVAMQLAARLELTPGQVLMPLAFGTILGGLTTLIGTPPNLIVSGFRSESIGAGFAMFDFTAVGLPVAVLSALFMELVVRTESRLQGRSARDIQLRTRYGLNLLAVSREGSRMKARLRTLKIRAGDLLLMQGAEEALSDFAADNGCVPLAERELRIPDRGKALAASLIMLAAVAAAALSLLPTAIAFAAGVLATMALRTLPLRAVYDAIDWPVIVLLGALMPVAAVMENTGTAALVAELLLEQVAGGSAPLAIGLILTLTMLVSCVVNNAATAAAMCPIALGAAATLGVSDDAFLMAVAIGASCAFLTPIGHQNNTLILGPGGFHFSDYWRLGLPVSLLVVLISVPLLLWVWPL